MKKGFAWILVMALLLSTMTTALAVCAAHPDAVVKTLNEKRVQAVTSTTHTILMIYKNECAVCHDVSYSSEKLTGSHQFATTIEGYQYCPICGYKK